MADAPHFQRMVSRRNGCARPVKAIIHKDTHTLRPFRCSHRRAGEAEFMELPFDVPASLSTSEIVAVAMMP